MVKKKVLIQGLVLASALVLAACGNGNSDDTDTGSNDSTDDGVAQDVEVNVEGFPIVDEGITLSLMAPGVGNPWEDMVTMQEYSEMTGIELEYSTPPIDDFETRFNLAFASGDLPDIIYAPGNTALSPAREVDYGRQGLLIPLNDLIDEYAPNLSALMEERPEVRSAVTTPDGNIYALPRVDELDNSIWPIGPVWYNGDWLDALDEDVPETLDEFYNLMVRFRDEDPNGNGEADEIPISNSGIAHPRLWFLSAFDLNAWGIEAVDGEVIYTPITENARAYYEFFNKLYEEDILDSEIFSQSNEMKMAKGEANQIGLFQDWFSFGTTGRTEEEAMNDPMFMPLTSELSPERTMGVSPGIGRGTFAITSENPYPEATMRWIDFVYSEEGNLFFNQGPEGHLWEWEDEARVETDLAIERGDDYIGTQIPNNGLFAPGRVTPVPPLGGEESDFAVFIREETQNKLEPYGVVAFPHVYFDEEELEEVQAISGDIATFVEEQEAQFITGQLDVTDDSVWENYTSTLESMNVERLIEINQNALDRNE